MPRGSSTRRRRPTDIASVRETHSIPDARGQLIDQREHIGPADAFGRQDPAAAEILELRVDADFGSGLEDAPDDDGARACAARDLGHPAPIERFKRVPPICPDGLLQPLRAHDVEPLRLGEAREQHARHASGQPGCVRRYPPCCRRTSPPPPDVRPRRRPPGRRSGFIERHANARRRRPQSTTSGERDGDRVASEALGCAVAEDARVPAPPADLRLHRFKSGTDFDGLLVAFVRVLGQAAPDDRLQRRRDPWRQRLPAPRAGLRRSTRTTCRRRTDARPLAISYSITPSAQMSLRAPAALAAQQFGRHVRQRARQRRASGRESRGSVTARRAGLRTACAQSEVEHLQPGPRASPSTFALLRSRWIDALAVRVRQRVGDLNAVAKRRLERQAADSGIELAQAACPSTYSMTM